MAALVALFVAWFGFAPVARALPQNQLLPRAEDGEGIKVGQRSRFHPGFGLGVGMNSNVFSEARTETPRTAAFMIATGWLGIGNRTMRDGILDKPPERSDRLVDYNVGLILGFRQYLDARRNILNQSRFNLGSELRFAFLPGRRFSVDLTESLYRVALLEAMRNDHDPEIDSWLRRLSHDTTQVPQVRDLMADLMAERTPR